MVAAEGWRREGGEEAKMEYCLDVSH